jgi:hypothetical protein
MSATGQGAALRGLRAWTDLLRLPDMANQDRDGYTLAQDLYFGNLPAAPTEIPYTWLTAPVRFRTDQAISRASVTRSGGETARAASSATAAEYGTWSTGTTLFSPAGSSDPANLAAHLVASYDVPRQRMPELGFNLLKRSLVECKRILERGVGDRISITDAPATWPAGATELVIEGIAHSMAPMYRVVAWNTSPVIGASAGQVGPWVRADQSQITGTDTWAF